MMNKRNRVIYFALLVIVVILGLASRKLTLIIPDFLDVYLGDTLWALMIFLGLSFIFINLETRFIALIGILFCYFIEFTQLYHAEWIDAVRHTTLGGLVLGYGFLWSDLLAYLIGIITGMLIDMMFKRSK
jgi:uncharacterized membrane protein YbhN (UPF0104 family)